MRKHFEKEDGLLDAMQKHLAASHEQHSASERALQDASNKASNARTGNKPSPQTRPDATSTKDPKGRKLKDIESDAFLAQFESYTALKDAQAELTKLYEQQKQDPNPKSQKFRNELAVWENKVQTLATEHVDVLNSSEEAVTNLNRHLQSIRA
jgi:hypothetical protein